MKFPIYLYLKTIKLKLDIDTSDSLYVEAITAVQGYSL